jgi:UDP-2-acetamido-2-deoxy-ribo-hexuluronate aminotransferase
MMALNLQPGDEVITACFTYVATAEVIALLKLKPVLVDVYPDTFDLDIDALKKSHHTQNKSHSTCSLIWAMRQHGSHYANCQRT